MIAGGQRFGTYLRALREARRLTLDDVEKATLEEPEPVTRSLLSRLELGNANISAVKLVSLARIYRVRVGLLAERLELDQQLEQIRHEGASEWSTDDLLGRAAAAGRAGQVTRALLLYEQAELRALGAGTEPLVRHRARLGVSRALAAAGRLRAARSVVEDMLAERLPHEERAWAFYYFAKTSLTLGHTLMARAGYLSLKEVPRPWPLEIEASAPGFEGEYLAYEGRLDQAVQVFLDGADAARRACDPGSEVHCLFRLAEIGRRRGRLGEALEWIAKTRELARAHGIAQMVVQAETEEGRIHMARRRPALARDAWTRGRQLARTLDLNPELFDIYLELWRLARLERDRAEERAALHNLRRLSFGLEQLPEGAADVAPLLRYGVSG